MPRSLDPITLGSQIVDQRGAVTLLFRELWETLRNGFLFSPDVANVEKLAQTAAIATVAAYTVQSAGLYRVSYYMRKTVADGVNSSLTFTWGFTESGIPLTESAAALTTDTTGAQQSGSKLVYADANTDLTYSTSYASNTPAKMTYRIDVVVEQLS